MKFTNFKAMFYVLNIRSAHCWDPSSIFSECQLKCMVNNPDLTPQSLGCGHSGYWNYCISQALNIEMYNTNITCQQMIGNNFNAHSPKEW